MNAYAVVIGGVSAFIIGIGVEDLAKLESSLTFKFLVAFLIVFTIFGFFHTVRWTYAFECHRQRVNTLVGLMNPSSTLEIVWEDLDMSIPPMELLPNLQRIWESLQKLRKFRQTCSELRQRLKKFRGVFRTRYWFPVLYFVVLILCAIVFSGSLQRLAFGCLGIALWLGTGFLFSEPR
jgi:hypothetical protein